MTRRKRILRNIVIGLLVFALVTLVVTIQVVQTDWFRNYVRQKIITATDEALGGKTEIGSFSFDWRHLEATIDDFVIHGKEPAGSPPLLRAARVKVSLQLFSSFKRIVSVGSLGVERPEVNVLVAADGSTNLPTPPHKDTSGNGTPLETIVDLAVGRFELASGTLRYNSAVQPLDVRANNLQVQLAYSALKQNYQGRLSLQPIYVVSGRNTPVVLTLDLPITLERDKISVRDAAIATALSELKITGSLDDLRNLRLAAKVTGHVSVVDLNNLGNLSLYVDPRPSGSTLTVDADAEVASESIRVSKLHLALGGSNVDANGTLRDPKGNSTLDFTSNLNLGELARLVKSTQQPSGVIALDGTAKMNATRIELPSFRLRAFGGEVAGDALVENLARYQVNGRLKDLNIVTAQRQLGIKPLPYSGTLSGSLEAKGDLQSAASTQASVNLSIAPGPQGIPVSGKINAGYDGATGDIRATNSFVSFPHSRLELSGSLKSSVALNLTSQDLNDFFAVLPNAPPVRLNGGQAKLTATVSGSFQDPRIAGHLTTTKIVVEDRQFDSLAADFNARSSQVSVENGALSRGMMAAQFRGSVGLVDWSPQSNQPLSLAATVRNGDLADILVLAGQPSSDYSGALTATVDIRGTVGNPTGSANVQVANGAVLNEPFDQIQLQVAFVDQRVTLPSAFLARGAARVNVTADYQHARDSFTTGHLTAEIVSNQIDLGQVRNVQSTRPNTAGTVELNTKVTGDADKGVFLLTGVNGDITARSLRFQGDDYGDLAVHATTAGKTVSYNLTSNFAGSQIRATGRTELASEYPTTLDANLGNLPVERLLAVAKRTDLPVKGTLSGTVHFNGTARDPQGSADLDLANAVVYEERLDHLRARVAYEPEYVDVSSIELTSGQSNITLSGRFDHPAGMLEQGDLRFKVQSARLDLARIRNVQVRRPGLAGALSISGEGSATLMPPGAANRIAIKDLTAHVSATGLAAEGKNLGNLDLAANTSAGKLNFTLESGIANASIKGRGNAVLSGDYPLNAEVTFDDVKWSNVQPLLGAGPASGFDGVTSGRVTVDGPVTNLEQLSASVRISTLQVRATNTTALGDQPLAIQNQGEIALKLDKGQLNIESAHLTGPQTDITASGRASMRDKSLDLRLNASVNLALLHTLNSDIFSSGTTALTATVQGTTAKPLVNGRFELHDATVSYADLPAGLANANGTVLFNDTTATFQNVTAESGGGRVTLSGFVTRGDEIRFAVRATANGTRFRIQQGVSVVATANLNVTGTAYDSVASGTVTIDRVSYLPQTDIGSLLTRSGPPVQAPSSPSPILENMKLDILVRTSSVTSVQASLAQNMQVDADLRIRGRASQPGVTGTVQMNHGQLAFFGSTYRISSGTISFYNPNRVEPILNISLETQAKGVTVVLNVTGPIDDMKLAYSSDPPLQFQEIVELLAAGKAPTSDPTLLANQPSQPPQNFQQRGETAIVSKALADPVSNRLQRVFGVSQLKIDPTFTSGSQIPQARVTLQQQVATNLVFTYVTALDNPNTQIIRIEWSMNPQWSTILNRDENGLVSVNLQYKKQFR